MPEWNGFGGLNLANVQESGAPRLGPGKYRVSVSGAKVESFGEHNANKRLTVDMTDLDGAGSTMEKFNLHFPSSPDAEQIGLGKLKSMLIQAGHANPDNPGDLETINGLKVGIIINPGKPYTNRNGTTITPNEVKMFFKVDDFEKVSFTPQQAPAARRDPGHALNSPGAPAGAGMKLDDEIPF